MKTIITGSSVNGRDYLRFILLCNIILAGRQSLMSLISYIAYKKNLTDQKLLQIVYSFSYNGLQFRLDWPLIVQLKKTPQLQSPLWNKWPPSWRKIRKMSNALLYVSITSIFSFWKPKNKQMTRLWEPNWASIKLWVPVLIKPGTLKSC